MLDDIVQNLFDNPGTVKRKILDQAFNVKIPFNSYHGLTLLKVRPSCVKVQLPFKRSNKNHVGSMHACGIATVGEYSAGLLIIKNFGFTKYRIILSTLEVEYFYQGKTDLIAQVEANSNDIERAKRELEENPSTYIQFLTKIDDKAGNLVANVKSKWQLKNWKKVRTKT